VVQRLRVVRINALENEIHRTNRNPLDLPFRPIFIFRCNCIILQKNTSTVGHKCEFIQFPPYRKIECTTTSTDDKAGVVIVPPPLAQDPMEMTQVPQISDGRFRYTSSYICTVLYFSGAACSIRIGSYNRSKPIQLFFVH